MERAVVARHRHEGDVDGGNIKKSGLEVNSFVWEIYIPLGYIPEGQDTSSTGVKYESKRILISTELLDCLKEAYFESDLQQISSGAEVNINLYDYTALVAIDALSGLTSVTKRSRSTTNIADTLKGKSGNEIGVSLEVVTAVAGGVAGGCSPILVLKMGVR